MNARIETGGHWPEAVEQLLRGLPLEERTDIWGPENPCLILVKPLG